MDRQKRLMRALDKACQAIMLMVAGAWLLTLYLDYAEPALKDRWHALESILIGAVLILNILTPVLRPQQSAVSIREPSPRWMATVVILGTGFAGAFALLAGASTVNGRFEAAGVGLVTFVIAIMVWRFATAHAHEIGEARFASERTHEAA